MKKKIHYSMVIIFSIVAFWFSTLEAPHASSELEEKVIEHSLSNGMRVLIVERHQVPLASFNISYKVGGVNEHAGITGIAHLYEHMAFKGTRKIGTTDYGKEKKILEKMDRVVEEIQIEQGKGLKSDSTRLEGLRQTFEILQKEAGKYVVPNEFSTL